MGDAGIYFYWSLASAPLAETDSGPLLSSGKLRASLGFLRSLPRVNGYSRVPSLAFPLESSFSVKYIYFQNYYFGAMYRISSLVLVFYSWAHTIINSLRIYALKFIFWRIRVPATISFAHTKEFPCINPAFVLLPEVFWYRSLFCQRHTVWSMSF